MTAFDARCWLAVAGFGITGAMLLGATSVQTIGQAIVGGCVTAVIAAMSWELWKAAGKDNTP